MAQTRSTRNRARVRARVDRPTRRRARRYLAHQGLTISSAIRLFLAEVCSRGELPFEVHLPNEVTRKAIREATSSGDLPGFSSVEELRRRYGF